MITHASSLERQAEALARAQKHWEDVQPTKPVRPWTIAVTREAGTPGSAVAEEIGRRLSWPVYDRELIERIARRWGCGPICWRVSMSVTRAS